MEKYAAKYFLGVCSLALFIGTKSIALDTKGPSHNKITQDICITPELIREAEANGQNRELRYIPGRDVVISIGFTNQDSGDEAKTNGRRGKVDHMEPDPILAPTPELIWEAENAPGVERYDSENNQYYIDRSPNPGPITKSADGSEENYDYSSGSDE